MRKPLMAAGLALALAGPLLPVQKAEAIDTSVCAKTSTFDCLARFGYGANDTGTWAESYYRGNTADAGYHNCTRFAAFYMAKYLGYGDPGSSYGAAWNWGLTDAEGGATNRTSLKERGFRVVAPQDILGGLRSTCTYVGARRLKELSKRTTFIRVSQQINTVFGES